MKLSEVAIKRPVFATELGAVGRTASEVRGLVVDPGGETPVVTIRPFNTYGPRQSARAVIPTIITQIANGKREIQLGSLHPTRDFNYVADTVSGFIAALDADAAVGEVINLGSNFVVKEISAGSFHNCALSENAPIKCWGENLYGT